MVAKIIKDTRPEPLKSFIENYFAKVRTAGVKVINQDKKLQQPDDILSKRVKIEKN